jgi:hypothetical protein
MLSGKVSKFSITSVLCVFSDSVPVSVSRVLRDHCQWETESESTFVVVMVYFGVLVYCLCSTDEILICFSLVFDRWMTTPMSPLEPMDGSVLAGCTTPGFPPCFGMCCTASVTRAGALQGPRGHLGSPHRPDHDGLVYHGSRRRPRRHSGEGCPPGPHGVL